MGYDGTEHSTGALAGISKTLRAASDRVEDGPTSPPAPDAGEVTGDVLRALGVLSAGAAKVVEGLAATSDAVTRNSAIYDANEQNVAADINRLR